MTYDPFRGYDQWKTSEPPEYENTELIELTEAFVEFIEWLTEEKSWNQQPEVQKAKEAIRKAGGEIQ